MPVTEPILDQQVSRLIGYFFPGQPAARFDALRQEFARAIGGSDAWDDRLLVRTTTAAIDKCPKLPRLDEFRAIADFVRGELEREVERPDPVTIHLALPAPQVREQPASELDESDPYACTPEERRRWAEQDAWIRRWAATLPPRPPEYAPPAEQDAWRRNQSVASWPQLTPLARRNKERRIAAERERALAQIRAALERSPRLMARHAAIVQVGRALGYADGSQQLREYVDAEYAAAVAAEHAPAGPPIDDAARFAALRQERLRQAAAYRAAAAVDELPF